MELNECINTRRSIRKYQDKLVPRKDLEDIVEAGINGPTWKNSQTSRYFVIQDASKAEDFCKTCLPERNANNAKNASIIVVGFIKNVSGHNNEKQPDNELGNMWRAFDMGLCVENMLLKAHELGLGTLVMGIRDGAAIKKYFHIDDDIIIGPVISVGYPDIHPTKPPRKSINDVSKFY